MKKIIIFTSLVILTSLALADHHKEEIYKEYKEERMKGKTFEEQKSHMLQRVEKRIQNMNTFKSCINSADNKEALRACRKEARGLRKDLRKEMKRKLNKN